MTRVTATIALVAVIVGCTAAPQPTLPPRPTVPDGWRTVISESELIELVVPPDLEVYHVTDLISGSRLTDGVRDPLMLRATSPLSLAQPAADESATEWAERSGALTGHQVDATVGRVERRDLLLPAGPALELTTAYRVDSDDYWTIVTVIDTREGYALLEFGGQGPPPVGPFEDIGLMQQLIRFGGR